MVLRDYYCTCTGEIVYHSAIVFNRYNDICYHKIQEASNFDYTNHLVCPSHRHKLTLDKFTGEYIVRDFSEYKKLEEMSANWKHAMEDTSITKKLNCLFHFYITAYGVKRGIQLSNDALDMIKSRKILENVAKIAELHFDGFAAAWERWLNYKGNQNLSSAMAHGEINLCNRRRGCVNWKEPLKIKDNETETNFLHPTGEKIKNV